MSADEHRARQSKCDAHDVIVSSPGGLASRLLPPRGAGSSGRGGGIEGDAAGFSNDRTGTGSAASCSGTSADVSGSKYDVSFSNKSECSGRKSSKTLRLGQGEASGAASDAGECFPGLPDDLALEILARVPRGTSFGLRGVSRAWQRMVRSPELQVARRQLGTLEEWLFALPEGPGRSRQLMALDPCLRRWTTLPPIPTMAHQPPAPAPTESAVVSIAGSSSNADSALDSAAVGPLREHGDLRAEGEGAAAPVPALEGFACVAAAGKLLVIGGVERRTGGNGSWRTEMTSAVWEFDPATWQWSPGPPMHTPRGWCAAGVLSDRFVYVSGGQGQSAFLNSVEMLDMQTRQWRHVSSMHMARCSHRTVMLGSTLLVLAGEWERHDQQPQEQRQLARPHGGITPYASMEIYDPATDSWTLLRDSWISTEKVPCPVAVVNGILYAAHHGSVHSWDLETRQWRYCGDTPGRDTFGRPCHVSGQGCAELDGRLVLFGGSRDVWLNRTRLTQHRVSTVHAWAPPASGTIPPRWPHLWEAPASDPGEPASLAQAGAAVSSFQSAANSIMLWKELPPMGAGHGGAILASAVVRA